ncbi:MAG: serine/threonine protein kinase [Deltaproteobacteria bacterium]|nr:MAG: serine/threonine protein kinase [Deltaproteobacteria bacterium]
MTGEVIGNYRLLKELGKGTYGTVYSAEHKDMPGIKAAVKLVHPALSSDPIFVSSIRSECQILHDLTHKHIVGFKDLIVESDRLAMVLELLDGCDLHHAIQSKQITREHAGDVLEQILEGLAYAHKRGVVHRDIKPGNIFVTADGTIKLLDFGISKAAGGTKATKTGTIAGTLDYMPPEAFDGITGPRIDLYAAGLVAWEIYVGHPACPDATPMRKMKWHVDVGVPDLWELDVQAPRWLRDLVLQLTNRDANVRPADGSEALKLIADARTGSSSLPPDLSLSGSKPQSTVTVKSGAYSDPTVSSPPQTGPGSQPPTGPYSQPPTGPHTSPNTFNAQPPPPGGPGFVLGSLVVTLGVVLGLSAGLVVGITLVRML